MCHCLTSSTYIASFERKIISGANELGASGPQPLRAKRGLLQGNAVNSHAKCPT